MNLLGRLALAIGYPQALSADEVDFAFILDGREVRAVDLEKRLVLKCHISRNEEELPRLASYSAGRMLREDAILYWDERESAAILSQEISADATTHQLKVFFETFADSCDWWLARTEPEQVDSSSFPEMVIRP